MKIFILIAAAISAYLICGINPAILFSRLVYHQDIRTLGSGNPGFTNFRRNFGDKLAWFVFLLDIGKTVFITLLFGYLFEKYVGNGTRTFGIAYTGLFGILGHCHPVWYKFKGGKGFLVLISTLFVLNWKTGIIGIILLLLFMFSTKVMSLSTILSMLLCDAYLFFRVEDLRAVLIFTFCTLIMVARHKENIKRLLHGEERKISFKHR